MSRLTFTQVLRNGQMVKAGDEVLFIDSDGIERIGIIQYETKPKERLWFRNICFKLTDYYSLRKVKKTKICYQCEKEVEYLFDDSRCGKCTRITPDEVQGL